MNNSERLKDKKIEKLKSQLTICQEKKVNAEYQCVEMSKIIEDLGERFAFYRGALDKGLDAKKMFLDEVPYSVQVDYEIKLYQHLVSEIKRKSVIVGWIGARTVKRMIKQLQISKKEWEDTRKKPKKDENLKIVE